MFTIFRFTYVGRGTGRGVVFEIFARKVEYADSLIERINHVTDYNLRRKRLFFKKKMLTDTPPYEVELVQDESVTEMEEDYAKGKRN